MMAFSRYMTLWSVVLFVGIWQIIAFGIGNALLFPDPLSVMRGTWSMMVSGELFLHTWASLQRILVGLAIGAPVGAVIGCGMGTWPRINAAFDPYLRMANATPAIALIPFVLIWLGVSEMARYALVTYVFVLTLALSARAGVAQVPALRLKAASCLGVTGIQAFFRVVVPSTFPSILSGIRTGTGLGVMVVVAAEMLGATTGLGYLIILGRQNYDPTLIFIGIIGLGILSILLDRGFDFIIERLLPRWSVRRRV